MAGKKKTKKKRVTPAAKAGISTRSYNALKKAAENVRSRISGFLKRSDADNFFIPSADEYTLKNLIKRVTNGEKVADLNKEMRAINSKNLLALKATPVISDLGYKLKPSEVKLINDLTKQANENIMNARKKWSHPLVQGILPELKNANEIIKHAVDAEGIQFIADNLRLYTEENLDVTAINEYGEAGTIAEATENRRILERQNARRQRIRDEMDKIAQSNSGYFLDQDELEIQDINIPSIEGIEGLRNKAGIWNDYGDVVRANRWLQNYEKTLQAAEAVLINQGMYNETVEERFKYIYDTIDKLWNNEPLITKISRYMPNIEIAIISNNEEDGEAPVALGYKTFDAIYNEWTVVDEDYFPYEE